MLQGRFLDDAHVFPLADATVVDLRLGRSFERWRLRLDLLNLTDERWDGIGYALPDFAGGLVPYVFPAPGFAARYWASSCGARQLGAFFAAAAAMGEFFVRREEP